MATIWVKGWNKEKKEETFEDVEATSLFEKQGCYYVECEVSDSERFYDKGTNSMMPSSSTRKYTGYMDKEGNELTNEQVNKLRFTYEDANGNRYNYLGGSFYERIK